MNGRNPKKPGTDPLGHHFRVYRHIAESSAFLCLSPVDVCVYLALGRDLRQSNNGDLSLTAKQAKERGIGHHLTLAKALRALRAVGLIDITSKGGCQRGGQRLRTLYRFTHLECYEHRTKGIEACKATNDWERVKTVEQGKALIADAEEQALALHREKTKSLGHAVTTTRTRGDGKSPRTRTRRDVWIDEPGHGVTCGEAAESPASMRVSGGFGEDAGNANHRTLRRPPLQVAIPTADFEHVEEVA